MMACGRGRRRRALAAGNARDGGEEERRVIEGGGGVRLTHIKKGGRVCLVREK